jgi:hypothetical protein
MCLAAIFTGNDFVLDAYSRILRIVLVAEFARDSVVIISTVTPYTIKVSRPKSTEDENEHEQDFQA